MQYVRVHLVHIILYLFIDYGKNRMHLKRLVHAIEACGILCSSKVWSSSLLDKLLMYKRLLSTRIVYGIKGYSACTEGFAQ